MSSILMLQKNSFLSATPYFLSITFFSLHPSHSSHSFLTLFFLISPDLHHFSSHLPTDRQSKCSRSDLASPFWPSSSLVRQCSVHPGGKTDGNRRQRETETKRKHHRGGQKQRRRDGKGKLCCEGLELIHSHPRLSHSCKIANICMTV